MKYLLTFAMLVGLSTLVSCGSSDKEEKPEEVVPTVKTIPEYVIVEASNKTYPHWLKEPEMGDKVKNRKRNRYFISESEHTSKRLCLKSAKTRASAHIAGEIAQFIKNTYAEATQGGGDEEVTEYMQEQLASETQAFVVGVQKVRDFWEKRFYKEELGAEKNRRVYNCFALVKISKEHLAKAIKNAQAKLYDGIRNPEVKKKTEKILEDTADAFNKIQ